MGKTFPTRWIAVPLLLAFAAMSQAGCASITHDSQGSGEAPVVVGPPARSNATPLATAYACYKSQLAGTRPIGIGVGDIKDYTGKFSDQEGNAITQGGALMAMSALGKLSPAIRQHERFDTRVAEMELVYMDRRQLGGEGKYKVDGRVVPWEPYYGGTIRGSDYFIVGGITELNYNIQSGGAELQINQIGPKGRTYVMNVAADLRIVDTRSLVVQRTVSLQKQIVGYEVGLGVFRFFGTDLVDIHAGAKNQEPLQLGVRTIIELGVLELVAAVTGIAHETCLHSDPQPAPIVTPKDAPYSRAVAPEEVVSRATPAGTAQAVAAKPEPDLLALAVVPVPTPAPAPHAEPPSISLSGLLGAELRMQGDPGPAAIALDETIAPIRPDGSALAARAAASSPEGRMGRMDGSN